MNQRAHPVATGRRVLLVEDDPDHLTIAQHHLKRLGGRVSRVETCGTLRDAELHARTGEFELVLLDLTLPDSALESTVEAIEGLSRHRAQVVAMSSLDVPEVRQRALARGAAAFLSKTKLDARSLTDLLDQLDASGEPGSDVPRPTATSTEAATPGVLDGKALASKLAHDANSWLTNAAFRVAALRQHDGTRDGSVAQEHLASISKSLEAMASIVSGSHAVLVDEITPITLEPIDLDRRLPELVESWRLGSARSALIVQHASLPTVAADMAALSSLFSILASNALKHGENDEGQGSRETVLRFAPSPPRSEDLVSIAVTDHGGPWSVANPERITDPTFGGSETRAGAGLGLHRARRWMERMGGSLEVVPREDVPGAFAVHLHFRRPG